MIDRPARLREQARWGVLAAAGVVLVWHSLVYNFVTDDAYISFVYSRNFAEHGELAFNLGDAVEGYTNFSWTVLLGLALKLGLAPELASRLFGTLCALGTLVVVTRTMDRAFERRTAWSVLPAVLLACSSGFACWTSGGLETQLFTLLVAGAIDGVVAAASSPRALRRAAICLALAAMTRPEGPLIAGVLGLVWLAHLWSTRRTRVPAATAIAPAAPGRATRAIAVAAALVCACVFLGGIGLATSYGALASVLGPGAVVAIVGLVAVPVFGLYDCARAARGHHRAMLQVGASLIAVGLAIAVGGIRYGAALDDVVTWNRALPVGLAALAVGAAALGAGFARGGRLGGIGAELVAATWFVGLWAPWFAWRWWYYGYPFPNTYYVKAHGPWTNPEFGSQMIGHGLHYVWVWLVQTHLIYVAPLAALGLVAVRPRSPRFVLAASSALLLVVYLGYTITVGGDFMGLHRFIMPLFVLAAIALVLGLEWLARQLPEERVVFPGSLRALAAMGVVGLAIAGFAIVLAPGLIALTAKLPFYDPRVWLAIAAVLGGAIALGVWRGRRRGICVAAALVLAGSFFATQAELTTRSLDPKNLAADGGVIDTPAFLIVYTEDRAKIGKAMADCFTADDFSIVGGAGAQPYFGRMRAIDVFGLVSDKIAHREPRSRPRSGHTKWGSDTLLAEYDPDFVFSCYRIHRTAAQPQLPCAGFWLRRGFEHVTLRIPGMAEQGEYYTFLAKQSRAFRCPNRVR